MDKILLAALRFSLMGEPLSDEVKNSLTAERLVALYQLSKKHDLAHLVADALDKNGLLPANEPVSQQFLQQRVMAVYRYEQSRYELQEMCRVFEEEKIENIPLKGSVLREYYPEPWMRTSCDLDIFVKKEDVERAVAALKNKLRYQHTGKGSHDESLYSESGVHLELHYALIEDYIVGKGDDILTDIWMRIVPVDGYVYRKAMTDEAFYFYHIAHMAKHFTAGGCGVRPFMDIWILNEKIPPDREKRQQLLQDGGYADFAAAAQKLSDVWFGNAALDKTCEEMQKYIFHGGVYGTIENRVAVQQVQKGSKFKYVLSRIFLPYEKLKHAYPVLKKKKWLTPFYQVVRWFRIVFKGGVKRSVTEFSVGAAVSDEKRERTAALLQELGLK